jgi:hypothetical protein
MGWLCVATIANVSVALYVAGWRGIGLSPVAWSVIVLVLGAGLAVAGLLDQPDPVFAAVFVWAFVGIAVKTPEPVVAWTAALLALGIMAATLFAERGRWAPLSAMPDRSV